MSGYRTALYRHFDADGRLLYVGMTRDPQRRLSRHKKSFWFKDICDVKVEWFQNRTDALVAERIAIQAEQPLHNVTHSLPPKKAFTRRAIIPRDRSRERLSKMFSATWRSSLL